MIVMRPLSEIFLVLDLIFASSRLVTCGGILLAWKTDAWSVSSVSRGEFSLTAEITLTASGESWCLTSVYGPQADSDKIRFLDKLRAIRASHADSWLVCGDFNLIYRVE